MDRRTRLRLWWKRPAARKVWSLAYHLRRSPERALELGMRALSLFELPILRRARFEALSSTAPILLADLDQEKFLVFTHDKIISKTVYATGSFEFEKFERVLRLLGEGFTLDTLVDVGANIGTISIPAVHRNLARRAIAIEPEPGNFRLLTINTELNDVRERFDLHNVALGAADGQTLGLELSSDNSGDHRIRVASEEGLYAEGERTVIPIRSETMDTVVGSLSRASALVWMDTQGYEGHILQGASRVLAERVPMVMEVWPYGMQRAGGVAAWRVAVASYQNFYDLAEAQPTLRPISELDELFRNLSGDPDRYTDVLLV